MGHKGKRIYNLEEISLSDEDFYYLVDKAGWQHPKKVNEKAAPCGLISDPDIIKEITKKTNWVNRLYVGSEEGLSACDWYLDRVKMIMYKYDGSMLVRWGVNNVL